MTKKTKPMERSKKVEKTEIEFKSVESINDLLNDFNNDDSELVEALALTKKVNTTDEVIVMNNTSGILVLINKTSNRQWILDRYGKRCRMTVGDILDIIGENGTIFTDGWALILDENVIKYLNLTDTYMKLISPKKMENLFDLPDSELKEILENLPKSLRVDMSRIIREKITQGNKALDSRNRVKLLEKYLGIKLDEIK